MLYSEESSGNSEGGEPTPWFCQPLLDRPPSPPSQRLHVIQDESAAQAVRVLAARHDQVSAHHEKARESSAFPHPSQTEPLTLLQVVEFE